MFRTIRIRLFTTAVALLPLTAYAGGAAQQTQQLPVSQKTLDALRPDRQVVASHAKPKIVKPTVKAESWGTQSSTTTRAVNYPHAPQWGGRIDPYKIEIGNLNKGTKVEVSVLGDAQPIEMPAAKRVPLMSAKLRKIVNREYNKQLAKAVATARKETVLISGEAPGPSSAQLTTLQAQATLPTNSKLIVRATDPFGRKYPTVRATVEGLPLQTTDTGDQVAGTDRYGRVASYSRTVTQTGGILAPAKQAFIQRANLKSTPVYERDGKTYAKVLGLAAFSESSTVTVTNVRMEAAGETGHTVSFKSNGYGAGAIEVPALLGDEFRVAVQTPGDANKQSSSTSTQFKLPTAKHGGPVDYLPVE